VGHSRDFDGRLLKVLDGQFLESTDRWLIFNRLVFVFEGHRSLLFKDPIGFNHKNHHTARQGCPSNADEKRGCGVLESLARFRYAVANDPKPSVAASAPRVTP
jgi:hypothetical protein